MERLSEDCELPFLFGVVSEVEGLLESELGRGSDLGNGGSERGIELRSREKL
jgi:hypothetical protein